jgi:hypothetical protein
MGPVDLEKPYLRVIQQRLDREISCVTTQPGVSRWSTWGSHYLQFKLPMTTVRLTGLSGAQYDALKESYPDFIAEMDPGIEEKEDIVSLAYRLDHPPAVSPGMLTLDGQYAPRSIRRQSSGMESCGIELTGINFEAQIGLGPNPADSSLGVALEHEFQQANVIENFLRVYTAHRALELGGVMLHSAGLVFDDKAYVFSGRSNAGKTTLTRKAYEIGARILSDDINLVLPGKNGYQAHAVPFTGEFGRTLDHRGGKETYPVAGIVLLEQSDSLATETVSQSAAVARLLTGSPFVNTDAEESEKLFDAVTGLVAQVPVIRLLSRRDDKIDAIMHAVKSRFEHE